MRINMNAGEVDRLASEMRSAFHHEENEQGGRKGRAWTGKAARDKAEPDAWRDAARAAVGFVDYQGLGDGNLESYGRKLSMVLRSAFAGAAFRDEGGALREHVGMGFGARVLKAWRRATFAAEMTIMFDGDAPTVGEDHHLERVRDAYLKHLPAHLLPDRSEEKWPSKSPVPESAHWGPLLRRGIEQRHRFGSDHEDVGDAMRSLAAASVCRDVFYDMPQDSKAWDAAGAAVVDIMTEHQQALDRLAKRQRRRASSPSP